MRELHAWMGDSPVGVFLEDSEGNVPLEYAKGVDMHIRLSLPLDGKAAYAHRRRPGARDVTPRHWEKLASENNLDPERVVGQARRMAGLVLSNIEEAYSDVEPRIRDRILMLVDSANTKIDPTYDSASMTDDPTGMLSGLMPPADEGRRL